MNAETDNIIEVVNEAIQNIALSTADAEQLLLTMLRNNIQQSEVEHIAGRYDIGSSGLLCSLLNGGMKITRCVLHLAVEKGVPPVHALAILQSNADVYEKLITKRDASALLELFEQIAEIAA
jgi:hypothetical protein